MSFGKSHAVRLDADGKKPLVFWDHQQSQANKPKKKYNYKTKGNKIPLRDSVNQEEAEPEQNKRPPPKRIPVKPSEATNNQPRGTTTSQKSSMTQNARTTSQRGKQAPTKTKDKRPVPDDKVTLTQSQFDKILETIGELTLLAEEKENTDTVGATNLSSSVDPNHQASQSLNLATTSHQDAPPNQQDDTRLSVDADPAVPQLDISSPRYPDPRSVPQGPVTGSTRSSMIGVPFAHMTKAERKRLEWERQKAEDAARQKQVDHTEKLHNLTTQQPTTASRQQAPSAATSNLYVAPQPPVPEPVVPGTAYNPAAGFNSVQQAAPTDHISSQPSSVPGLSQHREPSARVVSRSSVVMNEPAVVPGLSIISENQPNQSVPASRPAVVQNEPVSIPGLAAPQQAPVTVQPAPTVTSRPPVASRGPLTKAELKRLQWNKERAEVAKQTDWDPWGKPGAGAPIKDNQGNVLADFSTRKSLEEGDIPIEVTLQATNYPRAVSEEAIRQSFEDVQRRNPVSQPPPQPQTQHPHAVVQQPAQTSAFPPQQQQQQQTQPPVVSSSLVPGAGPEEAPPAAIRSSFNIGAIAPDENKYMSAKEQQRRQWLADLEKQREEQRVRKLQQIQKDAELDMKDMGYKDAHQNPGVPDPQVPQTQPAYSSVQQQPPNQAASYQPNPATQPAPYQPAAPATQPAQQPGPLPGGGPSQPQTDTFIRGQNVNMDDVTRRELEEKRKKQLEYQEYIKQQIDEKDRQKQLEREKKWKEEIEMEKKLQRERDEQQNVNMSEQDRTKQREETEKKRTELLRSAMEQEKERADWEKHEKRMLKLRKGGHDVSGYHATFQSKHTPRDGAGSVLTVAPSFIPGLGHVSTHRENRDNAPSQITSYPSPLPADADATRSVDARGSHHYEPAAQYTENRVLTPSAYRSPKREFGVQTDLLGVESLSRESTDIEYKGPIKKKVRVKSAAELKALKAAREKKAGFGSSVARPTEKNAPPKSAPVQASNKTKGPVKPILKKTTYKKPVPIKKRPAWGSSADKKRVVKQSERDPFYDEKRRQSEERGQLRQQKLLEIAEQEAPHVYTKTTAAVRARSRSRGREEDEFEAPGAVHVSTTKVISGSSRSRSPGHRVTRVESRSDRGYSSQRSNSPPVPALKNRNVIAGDMTDSGRGSPASYTKRKTPTEHSAIDQYNYDNYSRTNRMDAGSRIDSHRSTKKYSDTLIEAPVQNGQFVPFIRSTNILDPSQAEEPLPMSREPSTMQRARQAYVQELEPAKYGTAMENFNDSRIKENVPVQMAPSYNKDPIMNPSVVTDHPSHRQNRILQQLSDLRQGLMQKQRELEVGLQAEEVMG